MRRVACSRRASLAIVGAADLDATGSLLGAGSLSISGAADLTGVAPVAPPQLVLRGPRLPDGVSTARVSLILSGLSPTAASDNDLAAAGSLSITGLADLTSGGSVAAAGSLSITGSADLIGVRLIGLIAYDPIQDREEVFRASRIIRFEAQAEAHRFSSDRLTVDHWPRGPRRNWGATRSGIAGGQRIGRPRRHGQSARRR